MQAQTAYDLEQFMPREPRRRENLRVAEPQKRRGVLSREHLKLLRWLVVTAIFLALIVRVLQARTTSMGLTDQINSKKSELSSLQSEYAYLTNAAEMKLNSSDVEKSAQALGLYEPEQSQITYVDRSEEDTIVLPKNTLEQTLDKVATGAMSIMEYLEP